MHKLLSGWENKTETAKGDVDGDSLLFVTPGKPDTTVVDTLTVDVNQMNKNV